MPIFACAPCVGTAPYRSGTAARSATRTMQISSRSHMPQLFLSQRKNTKSFSQQAIFSWIFCRLVKSR
ncbi:hypothetical protein BIFDEN_01110 [Bifidobacterium dentium ATCC 27678]|nr:hypothetical protein BIFDEN_01110 [Bifidobacterium dentium ATCC 27678]